jgi:hypothetical protein
MIASALEKDSNAIVITLGDNTYPIGKPEEFSDCYDPTWGRFKERTLPSPGNHEYGMPKALGYYNYFGEIAGQSGAAIMRSTQVHGRYSRSTVILILRRWRSR